VPLPLALMITAVTSDYRALANFIGWNFASGRTMTKLLAKIVALALAFFVAVVIGWAATHPSLSDPKNIKYVLWKNGLYEMNLDAATDTMIGDGSREKLVIGKSKVQLRERFGYLSTPADVSQYLRGCYQTSAWKSSDALFIRNSPWMVIFDGDKATELVLIKGC
jgi:hypothetical protein